MIFSIWRGSLNKGVKLPFRREELGALNPYAVEFRYDDPIALTLDKTQVDHIAGQTWVWAEALVSGVSHG